MGDGMELACHNFCATGSHSDAAAEQKAAQFCKAYKQELPKPGAHQGCMDGHASGAKAAHKFAMEKHAEYLALKAATNATDAKIEEEITHATPEDAKVTQEQEAEAMKQVKEEAKKEATKTAEELEIAREAARAAYEAMGEDEETEETDSDSAEHDGNATEIDL